MKRFRYPGVRPFEAADRALFFGRDRDIADLYELVRAEPLVVLFGKSGYGKSSLLNAGVLPLFSTPERRSGQDDDPPEQRSGVQEGDDWLVLEIRFGEYTEGKCDAPLERLKKRLLEKIPATATNSPIPNSLIPNSLWLDFKQRLTPHNRRFLLVFDQFEEFFSYPLEQQAAFKDQLADLLYEEMPQAIRAAARSLERDERRALAARMEVKALFAIRSDRMSDLDRLKDRLPAILHKRYELRALTREQAREAVVRPALLGLPSASEAVTASHRLTTEGATENSSLFSHHSSFLSPPFEYQEDALRKILDELSRSNAGVDRSGGIESFQLQILCDDIDNRVASGLVPDRDGNGLPDVSAADLPDFSEVFARYYERRLALLDERSASGERSDDLESSDRKARTSFDDSKSSDAYKSGNHRAVARRVIEDGLVRYDAARHEGRRLSVDEQALLKDFEAAGLTPALLRELENTFLVRREPNSLGGHNYELSHDTLLAPVISAKKKRLEEEARERLQRERERLNRARRRNAVVGLAAFVLLGFALWQTYAAQIVKANAEALLEASQLMAKHKLPENFDALIPLDSLDCSSWYMDSLSPEIGKLKNLKKLNLRDNKLTHLPKEIGSLQNLQALNLRYNQLTELPPEIGNLQNLQSLDLERNSLTSLLFGIGNLKNLQSLYLNHNRLTSLSEEIGSLQNLQSLDLSNNELTNLPEEIGKLQNLQWLDVSYNQLNNIPIETLKRLKNLKRLDLRERIITVEEHLQPRPEVEALRQAMPWCEVVW